MTVESMNEWNPFEEKPRPAGVRVAGGVELHPGDRVRLCPRKTADILDLALKGQTAIIEAIEQDFDDQVHIAVILDHDPGRDLGALRQPGHRFFFSPDEVEPLAASLGLEHEAPVQKPRKARILVAGIGNIFLGDDAFGVEVIRLLAGKLPETVRVADFGIRSFDLAYALMENYEAAILVDATPRQGTPGTLYTIEPDLENLKPPESAIDAHSLDPVKVLAYVRALGGRLHRVFVVGCEPDPDGTSGEGRMGLSAPVQAALGDAVKMIEALVTRLLHELPADSDFARIA